MLWAIVTGGQTGVDRAAMRAARRAGLALRGWCPAGRSAEDGPIGPEWPLVETPSADPAQRTRWNARESEGTLVLSPFDRGPDDDLISRGTELAIEQARRCRRPRLLLDPARGGSSKALAAWVRRFDIRILNIAGPRESEWAGAEEESFRFLAEALPALAAPPERREGLVEVMNRAGAGHVALETTVLVHGVPREQSGALARDLVADVHAGGSEAAFVGVVHGRPTVGMTGEEVGAFLQAPNVMKANTSNMGLAIHAGRHAATTVSATMELASASGVRVFATGGIGGVHAGYGERLDISADLAALARFPVAVVSSGVKSILDVESTREALETLGVPVVGFHAESFPAFYRRESGARLDASFDSVDDLARYVRQELARTGRGVLVANPIPETSEIPEREWDGWLTEARRQLDAQGMRGRAVTPRLLALLHEVSEGATLRANIALIRSNAKLAGRLCAAMRTA